MDRANQVPINRQMYAMSARVEPQLPSSHVLSLANLPSAEGLLMPTFNVGTCSTCMQFNQDYQSYSAYQTCTDTDKRIQHYKMTLSN